MFSFSICAEPLDLHYIPVKIADYWTFDLFQKLFMEIIIFFAHGNMKIDLHLIQFQTNPFSQEKGISMLPSGPIIVLARGLIL
jgi:hypothetical protein